MRPIDADALIGSLHNHAFLEGDDRSIVYNVIQKQPTVGGWISVKDRLPEGNGKIYEVVLEESNPVLVYGKDEDGELTFGVSSYVYDHSEPNDSGWDGVAYPYWDCESCTITHWMPLPEAPSKEDDNG